MFVLQNLFNYALYSLFLNWIKKKNKNIFFFFLAKIACLHDKWQCDDGTCLSKTLRCNGNIDCPEDISDERHCDGELIEKKFLKKKTYYLILKTNKQKIGFKASVAYE